MLCVYHFRYWEALHKWDEALQLTPNDEKLYEMRAQVRRSLMKLAFISDENILCNDHSEMKII